MKTAAEGVIRLAVLLLAYVIVLAVLLLAAACAWCDASAQTSQVSSQPGCAVYKSGEKHLPNVPACSAVLTIPEILHKHAGLVRRVQSCEKRNWPVNDPVCVGISLSFAHAYVDDHPEWFGPDALKVKTLPAPEPPISENNLIYSENTLITPPICGSPGTQELDGSCSMTLTVQPDHRGFECVAQPRKDGEPYVLKCTWNRPVKEQP